MVVALLYEMETPCNCFTLSLSGSDSRRSNSWRDDKDATMEIKGVKPVTMAIMTVLWRWSWGCCSAAMEGFVIGAAPMITTARLKQDKRDNVNLSGILIASPINDVKYITTKC